MVTARNRGRAPGGASAERTTTGSRLGSIFAFLRVPTLFSSLQRRIIFFNLIGLALLVAGMTFLTNNRQHLIGIHVDALHRQAQIIAIGIAETTAADRDGVQVIDPAKAANVLRRLARPADVRIRLYDRKRRVVADTSRLLPRPAKTGAGNGWGDQSSAGFIHWVERSITRIVGYFREPPEIYRDVPSDGNGLGGGYPEGHRSS